LSKKEEPKKESLGKRIAKAPLKALVRLGDWERKQIKNLQENRAKQKELDKELKVIEDAAFLEESKRLAKKRGKQKAVQRSQGFLGGMGLQMPNLWEGMEEFGEKKGKEKN
jgi:hypothetical protein